MFDGGRFGLWVAGGWEGDAEGSLGFSAVLSGHATAGKGAPSLHRAETRGSVDSVNDLHVEKAVGALSEQFLA